MELWRPAEGEPELLAWWRPLLEVARLARADEVPWPIHIDEFDLEGRVDRGRRTPIWVYRHRAAGGGILADAAGTTYRFVPYKGGRSSGRFVEITVRDAVWKAGLPHAVAPSWPDPPMAAGWSESGGAGLFDDDAAEWADCPPVDQVRRRVRHLRLVHSATG